MYKTVKYPIDDMQIMELKALTRKIGAAQRAKSMDRSMCTYIGSSMISLVMRNAELTPDELQTLDRAISILFKVDNDDED